MVCNEAIVNNPALGCDLKGTESRKNAACVSVWKLENFQSNYLDLHVYRLGEKAEKQARCWQANDISLLFDNRSI